MIGGRAQGAMSVTADNVCRSGTVQRDYTKELLEYLIDVNYLTYSLYSGCFFIFGIDEYDVWSYAFV